LTPVPSITDIATLLTATGTLLAAIGVSSVITAVVTHTLSRRGEKRELRMKVREELSAVQEFRWAVIGSEAMAQRNADLLAARRRLRSAAMLAHLPRKLVEEYDRLALAAFTSSKESLEASGQNSVPGVVTECVDRAYRLMCDLLWRPVLTRATYPLRFWRLKRKVKANKTTDAGSNLRWAYVEP
jgi:hypothetical protein